MRWRRWTPSGTASPAARPFELVLRSRRAHMPGTAGWPSPSRSGNGPNLPPPASSSCRLSGVRLEDPARIRELHLDAHLLKPIQQDELLETIDRVMRRAEIDATPARNPEKTPMPVGARLNILVAEDNEFNTRHMERLLIRKGHEVRLAKNGLEAARTARDRDGGHRPGVGSGAVAGLRTMLSSPWPPSRPFRRSAPGPSHAGTGWLPSRPRHPGAGSGHLQVTFRSMRFDGSLEEGGPRKLPGCRHGRLSLQTDPDGRAVPRHRSADREPYNETRMRGKVGVCSTRPSYCSDVVGRRCGEGLRSLCEDFRIYFPGRLAEVRNALREGDSLRLREAAHKLYGLLSAFSSIAGSLASDLEERAARGELSEASPLVDQLESLAHELVQEVDAVSLEGLQSLANADGDGDHRPAQDATE